MNKFWLEIRGKKSFGRIKGMKFWSRLPVGVLKRRFFSYSSIELGKFI